MRAFLCLMALVQAMTSTPQSRAVLAMKSGLHLRMHVVAQDDTPAMQSLKLRVRDAVRDAYALGRDDSATMLDNARRMLPALASAAEAEARAQGYAGEVRVELTQHTFDDRTLEGVTIPGGRYPALMICLGEAQGRNWWGLIDPEAALGCAGGTEDAPWSWSPAALWAAVLRLFGQEVAP